MRAAILALVVVLAACGDDELIPPAPTPDAELEPDAMPAQLGGCLDVSGMVRPPSGQLPCDLIPPGLVP